MRNKWLVLLLILCISFGSISTGFAAASPAVTADSGSGSGLLNILLGLLLGKFFGNVPGTLPDIGKVLSGAAGPADSAAPPSTGKTDIITEAQKYMGVPYVWGGETPDGFDCSGFTRYVLAKAGISVPRTAAEQYAVGTPVDKGSLQAGDLVFFTTYKPGASHVGFYMGGGKFIHASSAAAKVTVSSLDESYYTEHYIGARRYGG